MTEPAPGDTVRWHTPHGWYFGKVVTIGPKWTTVERCGKQKRIANERIRPTVRRKEK